MSFAVVWRSRPDHLHVMEISDPRSARQLANTLQSRQGTASVVDKATGAVVFRPPWLQPGKPLKRRAPRAH